MQRKLENIFFSLVCHFTPRDTLRWPTGTKQNYKYENETTSHKTKLQITPQNYKSQNKTTSYKTKIQVLDM